MAAPSLFLWRAKSPPSAEEVEAFISLVGDTAIDDTSALVSDWTNQSCGTLLVSKDAPLSRLGAADCERLDHSDGFTQTDDDVQIDAPSLPAPPLALKSRHPVDGGFELRLSFDRELQPNERDSLEELCAVFESAYASASDGTPCAVLELVHEETQSRFMLRLNEPALVEDHVLRGHVYWLVEVIDRFFPVSEANFVGAVKSARGRGGLRPSWLGPVVVMVASLLAARFAAGPVAARASILAWLFLPLVFTFLSRRHVGKLTWAMAVLNALVQGAAAVVLENPTMLWPPPDDLSELVAYHIGLEQKLIYVLYGARLAGLTWVAPYLMSRNRPI